MSIDPTDPAWKRAKKRAARYVKEWEADERLSLTVQRKRARLGFPSKVANGAPRRDILEDRDILLVLQGFAKAKNAVGFQGGRRSAVDKEATPLEEIKPGEEERCVHRVWVPDWTHTGDRLKTVAMGGVLLERGCSTLNMNPSERVIQAALASPRGFVGYMTDRITRSLKRHMGSAPAFFFMVEGSPLHSLHLHGMIEMPTPDAKAAIRAALLDACGGEVARGYERAVRTAPVFQLSGWIDYIAKATLLTEKELATARVRGGHPERSEGLLGATRELRASARAWFDERRASGEAIVQARDS